jgi:hypothetical protein
LPPSAKPANVEDEEALHDFVDQFYADPLGFVMVEAVIKNATVGDTDLWR